MSIMFWIWSLIVSFCKCFDGNLTPLLINWTLSICAFAFFAASIFLFSLSKWRERIDLWVWILRSFNGSGDLCNWSFWTNFLLWNSASLHESLFLKCSFVQFWNLFVSWVFERFWRWHLRLFTYIFNIISFFIYRCLNHQLCLETSSMYLTLIELSY